MITWTIVANASEAEEYANFLSGSGAHAMTRTGIVKTAERSVMYPT